MDTRTVVGAVLSAALLLGGCGCVTAKPAPPKPAAPAPSPEPEEERSCTTCLEVCYPTEGGALICESECEEGHDCPMHEAKERADAIRKLLEPPTSPKPPHQNQDGPGPDEGGRTYEL